MVKKSKPRLNIPIRHGVETTTPSDPKPKSIAQTPIFMPPNPRPTQYQQTLTLSVGELGLELATHFVFMMAGIIFGFFIAKILLTIP